VSATSTCYQLTILTHSCRSKYPLSLVAKAVETFGEDIVFAYDIACSFKRVVANSSIGPIVKAMRIRMLVPAFHAYPHNRHCQIRNHPLYFRGVGLEDFETCERLFSLTNGCAGSTRHVSEYHRTQILDGQFRRNDSEHYIALGKSIPFGMMATTKQ